MWETRSAGGVVLNKDGHVLVVNQNHRSWSLPKGHIEKGETAMQAALREIEEETGVTRLFHVKDLGIYERFRIGLNGEDDLTEKKSLIFFLFTTDETDLAPQDDKHPEARWVKPGEVAALLTHPKDQEFFRRALTEIDF